MNINKKTLRRLLFAESLFAKRTFLPSVLNAVFRLPNKEYGAAAKTAPLRFNGLVPYPPEQEVGNKNLSK